MIIGTMLIPQQKVFRIFGYVAVFQHRPEINLVPLASRAFRTLFTQSALRRSTSAVSEPYPENLHISQGIHYSLEDAPCPKIPLYFLEASAYDPANEA